MSTTLLKRDSNTDVFLLKLRNFRTPPVVASEIYILSREYLEHFTGGMKQPSIKFPILEVGLVEISFGGLIEGN